MGSKLSPKWWGKTEGEGWKRGSSNRIASANTGLSAGWVRSRWGSRRQKRGSRVGWGKKIYLRKERATPRTRGRKDDGGMGAFEIEGLYWRWRVFNTKSALGQAISTPSKRYSHPSRSGLQGWWLAGGVSWWGPLYRWKTGYLSIGWLSGESSTDWTMSGTIQVEWIEPGRVFYFSAAVIAVKGK